MKLIITIDTEEDNWSNYSTTNNPVTNVERIVALQEMFDQYGARPTYLITYPVATNPRSVTILRTILEAGKCEIGMHCHPWNTPPFDENAPIRKPDTMLCNLPDELVLAKMTTLHEAICNNFAITPTSFRAGRWGFGPGVARALCQLGYRVDSSVTPYINWKHSHGPDYSDFSPEVFRFSCDGLDHKKNDGVLLEFPVTIGFLQGNFTFSHQIYRMMENPFGRRFRLKGLFDRLHLLNKVWLSPENNNSCSMVLLAKRMEKLNYNYLNFYFHSTSLLSGLSPFVTSSVDEKNFLLNIRSFLDQTLLSNWEFVSFENILEK